MFASMRHPSVTINISRIFKINVFDYQWQLLKAGVEK